MCKTHEMPRRSFIESLIAVSTLSASALPIICSCSRGSASSATGYLNAILGILKKIKTQEIDAIRDASNLFADTIISRNRCFIFTKDTATAGYPNDITPGLPRVFIPVRSRAMAEIIHHGDVILTSSPGEIAVIAGKMGATVVGLTSPVTIDDYAKKESVNFTGKQRLGDISSILIRSHLPLWDGLVKHPKYPFGILPGSGPVHGSVITAVAGETYRRSGGIGLTNSSSPEEALSFLETVTERIVRLHGCRERIREAGSLAAKKILNGGRLWVYDRRDDLRREISGGAGVPVFAQPLSGEGITDGTLQSGDVLIFGSLMSNDRVDLDMINKSQNITDAIISLCPHDQTGGYRIFKKSAVSLNNLSYEKDGIRTFDNGTKKFMQTGNILNSVLLWMVLGETTDSMILTGETPDYLMGTHLAGSEQYNADSIARARKRDY